MPEGTEPQDCTKEKTTFTLTEFKELVHSAQNGDREAINTLCNAFKPLIYKEAYRDFGHLPGLLQYHVHYGLLHKFTRGKSVKDCYYLDAEEEGEETQIADKKNDIDELMHNQLLSDTMRKLTKEQFTAVNELVLQDVDYKIFCDKHKCSVKTAYKHRANSLKKLKAIIA